MAEGRECSVMFRDILFISDRASHISSQSIQAALALSLRGHPTPWGGKILSGTTSTAIGIAEEATAGKASIKYSLSLRKRT